MMKEAREESMSGLAERSRTVFVTGASRGIGRAIALRLLAAGHRVALGYEHNRELAEDAAEGWSDARVVRVDVASRKSIRDAIRTTEAAFDGAIEVLVNNAAIAQEKPFLELDDDDWDRMLAVNLRSNFAFSQEVLPAMLEAGWGRLIQISSIGGQWGGFNQVHYAAAKAAQINLTRSLAKLYSGSGVTSHAVAVGLAATDMSARELASDAGRAKVDGIPAGRLGTPEEIAAVVDFLASDAAAYLTGQTLNLNGGMSFG